MRRAPRLQVARARQQQERLPREVPVDLPRRPRAARPQAARGDLLPRGHTRALHPRRGLHGRARARDVRRGGEHPQGRARRRGARRLLAVQLRGVGAVRRAGRGGRGVQDPADRGRAPLRVARRHLHEVQDRRALRERRARHGDRHVVLRAQGVPRLRLLRQRERGRLVRVPRLPQGQGPARRKARGVRRPRRARRRRLQGPAGLLLAAVPDAPPARHQGPHPQPRRPGARRRPRPGVRGAARCRVSVNLFFTSFAKQARRSRKGGFTGCANVFSPIPVTA